MFTASLDEYRLLWPSLVSPVAGLIVLAELCVVAALLQPGTKMPGALLAILLLLVYAAVIGINLLRGRTDMSCGCSWGRAHEPIQPAHVFRNLALAALAGVILLPHTGRELLWLDWLSAVFATLVLALIYMAAEALVKNLATTP